MKKVIIFIIMLLIFLASCGIGYFYLNTRNDQKRESKVDEIPLVNNEVKNEYVSTETKEEKISPNAELTKIVLYKKCGHEIAETTRVSKDIVNLDEKEFENKYKDYQLEDFSDKQISVYKEVDKMCPEHYKIGSAEGIINIYVKNENGEDELYEVTNIALEYLPEEEKEKLRNGIDVVGEEELNSILENLES